MIRIDEIYHTVFWAWLQQHRAGMRVFYFYPAGSTDCDSICNYGRNDEVYHNYKKIVRDAHLLDNNYTVFFDQEPADLRRHQAVFDRIKYEKNIDITQVWEAREYITHGKNYKLGAPPATGIFVTSEKNSETVEEICRQYQWRSAYYFFHGWASLDWFRGYNRTYLMPKYSERRITHTFIMPNRIIAGDRQHRLIMLYHIFKNNLHNNHISCPAVCPAENISIHEAVRALESQYPDIQEVFACTQFPKQFVGEANAPMHSYKLSLFNECSESLLYLVTETVARGRRLHLTEKTFKPIALKMPFVIVGTQGSLAYLRSYGFRTFDTLWSEAYDTITDDAARYASIATLLTELDALSAEEKQALFDAAEEICEYNYQHFYSGGFEAVLWRELTDMLAELSS